MEQIRLDLFRTPDQPHSTDRPIRQRISTGNNHTQFLHQARQDGEIPSTSMGTGRDHASQRLIRDGTTITDRRSIIFQPLMQVVKDDPGLNVRDGRVTRENGDGRRKEVGSDLPGRGAGEIRG